jgi:type I restriction enzyme S subunit
MDTEIKSSNWETKTLGEVCEVVGGGTPKTGIPEYWSDEIVWVTPKDLGQLSTVEIFDTNKYISKKGLEKSSAKLLPKGSVVMSSRAPIGYVAIAGVDLATNQGCRNFICHDNIFNKYLYYFLFANTELLNSLGGGATFREISGTTLKDIEIPVPPLSEQKRIVKILDEKFGVIEELQNITKKQIADVKELFESRLGEVFSSPDASWHEVVFCDVCKITSKLIDPKEKKYENLVHVGAGNIIAETGELVNLKTAKEEKLISGKFIFDTEMVLYSKIRPYLMKTVRPDFSGLCSADIYPLKPKDDVLIRDFLYYLLFSKQFTEYAIKGSARAGMPKVNREHMFAYSFFLPGIKKQKQLVKELDELSKKTKELEATFLRKTADLEELKKSYLADAFAGKL